MWPFSKPEPEKSKPTDDPIAWVRNLSEEYPIPIAIGGTLLLAAGLRRVYKKHFYRLKNSDWITPDVLANKRWIRGYVTSVGDADNFRLYHTPGFGWRWPLKFRTIPNTTKELKDQTIHIRLSGIDAPEAAHFGRTEQLYAKEALAWLKSAIENRFLYCQLVRKDQYSRIVAHVHLPPRIFPGSFFIGRSVSLMMLREGWAVVYEQSGAEYTAGGIEAYKATEAKAKRAKRGIWAQGKLEETPAEWKKRYREIEALGVTEAQKQDAECRRGRKPKEAKGFFRRLFGF